MGLNIFKHSSEAPCKQYCTLLGTFKEGLAASSADAGGKEKLPPRSLPRRTAHAAASKAPTKAQSASSSSSAVTVSRGPTGGTSYTYQFTKGYDASWFFSVAPLWLIRITHLFSCTSVGVFCDGERRKGIGGHGYSTQLRLSFV